MKTKKQKISIFFTPGIYPVITPEFCPNNDPITVLKKIADAGAELVQLRIKNQPDLYILKTADAFKKICEKYNIILIINDRPDIALACGADGVHLGQNDLPPHRVAKFANQLIIGVSTHSLKEAITAEKNQADYINIGPIFQTSTKTTQIPPLGINAIKKISQKLTIPFTVMGGIKAHHLIPLLKVGAKKIAMITEICQAKNIKKKFLELNSLCKNY